MIKTTDSLQVIYEGWNGYHQSIVNAVKPLAPDQLIWRPAKNLYSVGELVRHINLGRITRFMRMDVPGCAELASQIDAWERDKDNNQHIIEEKILIADHPIELVYWLEITWQMIENILNTWKISDLCLSRLNWMFGSVYHLCRM